jgi:hypothetical protein
MYGTELIHGEFFRDAWRIFLFAIAVDDNQMDLADTGLLQGKKRRATRGGNYAAPTRGQAGRSREEAERDVWVS